MAYNFSEGSGIFKIIILFMGLGLYYVNNDNSNNNSSTQKGGKRKHRTRKNKKIRK